MKLTDFDAKTPAKQALKESFDVDLNIGTLDKLQTKQMLGKVKRLVKEAKQSPSFYQKNTNDSYMKLVFMEQALTSHYKALLTPVKIVVENEEVEKSQVILAAQDMVDSVQKMIEDVSDMQVKELPALVNSIQSEIGAKESSTFNSKVSEALSNLNSTLQEARTELQNALNIVTGQESFDSFDSEEPELGNDMEDDLGMDDDIDLDLEDDLELDFMDDNEEELNQVGRAKR